MYRAAAYMIGGRGKVKFFPSTVTTTTTRLRDVVRSLSSGAVHFPSDTNVLLCSNVPVEPGSSAAGVRTAYLLERLVTSPGVTSVHFASPNHQLIEEDVSSMSAAAWKHKGVQLHELPPNQSVKARELLLNKIPNQHGENDNLLVIFDRFYSEEMYSFHGGRRSIPTSAAATRVSREIRLCLCGRFRHAPNVDAVRQLKRLWPRIRQQVHTCRAAPVDEMTTKLNYD